MKQQLRAQLHARRAGADPALGQRLVTHALPIPPGVTVAGYWPLGTEIDPRPLLRTLHARGHAILLPQTPPRGQPLTFRRWQPGAAMLPGRFGTLHPDGPLARPDLLLVPLLAFDARCHRLGYGGGYYDRTIAALPGIRTIGLAYALQEVPHVPTLPHDQPLDAIATEGGVILNPEP